jgi:hypothetical protein
MPPQSSATEETTCASSMSHPSEPGSATKTRASRAVWTSRTSATGDDDRAVCLSADACEQRDQGQAQHRKQRHEGRFGPRRVDRLCKHLPEADRHGHKNQPGERRAGARECPRKVMPGAHVVCVAHRQSLRHMAVLDRSSATWTLCPGRAISSMLKSRTDGAGSKFCLIGRTSMSAASAWDLQCAGRGAERASAARRWALHLPRARDPRIAVCGLLAGRPLFPNEAGLVVRLATHRPAPSLH